MSNWSISITDEQAQAAAAALAQHGSKKAAAAAIGMPRATFQRHVKRAAERGFLTSPPIPKEAQPPEGYIIKRHNAEYAADGALKRQWIGTTRDPGAAYAVPDGHTVQGESALLDPDGRVLAKWVKTAAGEAQAASLIDALQHAFTAYKGAAPVVDAPEHSDADLLTVYPIPDLHFGMRAWHEETGADYDLKIASAIAHRSISALVQQSVPSEHAVIVILGDWWHQNDSKNATPNSGHQLDVDGRWAKVYLEGCKLARALIELVASRHQSVQVVVRRGNHDEDAAVTMAVALSMFYENNPRISVDLTPSIAWYRRFGLVLIGAHHGHTMTPERAAMAMAVDCAEDWGKTKFRMILSGHRHHGSAKEIAGVRVETLTSPAGRDAWNAGQGYRSSRALTAITFHAERGEIGRHRVEIDG